MKKYLAYSLFLAVFLFTNNAFAEPTDAREVFSKLATTAGELGMGLRNAGFLIAGFGLIVFSFMAIFNKISWKTLAYIMLSTFILSTMIGIIGYIKKDDGYGNSNLSFSDIQDTGDGWSIGGSPRVNSGHRN